MAEQVVQFRGVTFNGNLTGSGDIYMLYDIPEGLSHPQVRESEQQKQGQHGIIDQISYYGKRLITLTGRIVSDSESGRVAMENALKAIFRLDGVQANVNASYYDLTITDEAGVSRVASVKIVDGITFSKEVGLSNVREFIVTLKARDPRFFGSVLNSEDLSEAIDGTDFRLPTLLPVTISPDIIYDEILNNGGNFSTPTIITLTGESTNPRIINQTTGVTCKLNTTISGAEVVVIDSELGTIEKDGVDISSSLDNSSKFIHLDAGDNLIECRDDTPTATDLVINIKWKDAYV